MVLRIGESKLLCRFDIILVENVAIELGRFDFLLMKTWWDRSIPFGKIAGEILDIHDPDLGESQIIG